MPAEIIPHSVVRSQTREYGIWKAMIQRCTNPNHKQYRDYGGRGVRVCKSWKSFDNFFLDMGKCPPGLTLERTNNSGNYEKSNCVWASHKTQHRNSRRNILFNLSGKPTCLAELCESLDKNYVTIYYRLRRGWTIERAFGTETGPFYGTKNKSNPPKCYKVST